MNTSKPSLMETVIPAAARSKAAAFATTALATLAGCTTYGGGSGFSAGHGVNPYNPGQPTADAGSADAGGGSYPGQQAVNNCDGRPDFLQVVAANVDFNVQIGNAQQAMYGQLRRVMSSPAGTAKGADYGHPSNHTEAGDPMFALVENVRQYNNPGVSGGNILVSAEYHGFGDTHIGKQQAAMCKGNLVETGSSVQLTFGQKVDGVQKDNITRTEEHRDMLTLEIGQYASMPGATIQNVVAQLQMKHPNMVIEGYTQQPNGNWAVDCEGTCITVTLMDLNQKSF